MIFWLAGLAFKGAVMGLGSLGAQRAWNRWRRRDPKK